MCCVMEQVGVGGWGGGGGEKKKKKKEEKRKEERIKTALLCVVFSVSR